MGHSTPWSRTRGRFAELVATNWQPPRRQKPPDHGCALHTCYLRPSSEQVHHGSLQLSRAADMPASPEMRVLDLYTKADEFAGSVRQWGSSMTIAAILRHKGHEIASVESDPDDDDAGQLLAAQRDRRLCSRRRIWQRQFSGSSASAISSRLLAAQGSRVLDMTAGQLMTRNLQIC